MTLLLIYQYTVSKSLWLIKDQILLPAYYFVGVMRVIRRQGNATSNYNLGLTEYEKL